MIVLALPAGWLLFGSGTLAALLIAAADRVVADARQRERIGLRLFERELACAVAARRGTGEQVRAAPAPVLEGTQMASLGDLRRRIRAGEFADDTATAEQARLRWARWGVAHGVFGEQATDEPEPRDSEDAEEASDAPPTR